MHQVLQLFYQRVTIVHIILLAFLCFFYAAVSGYFLFHVDIGWHLATGDLILDTHTIPATDPWSYNSHGTPWYNIAWLWDVIASALFKGFGGMGLLVLTLSVGVATMGLLATLAMRIGAQPVVTLVLAAFIGATFPFYEPPDIFLAAAPQQMTLLFSAWLLLLLWNFQNKRGRGSYLAISLLFMVWGNMHAGFIIGHVMLAAMGVAALLKGDKPLAGKTAILLALSAAAVLVNPYGLHIIDGMRGTLGHVFQSHVSEWQPMYKPSINLLFLAPSLIYSVIFLAALAQKRLWKNSSPFLIALAVISVLLLVKGILALRYFSLFLLVSLPITARGVSSWLPEKTEQEPRWPYPLPTLLVIALVTLGILRVQNPAPIGMSDIRNPKPEIDFILQHYPNARILNHWNFGSFLIFETRGKLQPFIDGRMGTAYPDEVFVDFKALYATHEWDDIIQKYHIDLVLWPHMDSEMLAWFDRHPRWKPVFTGNLAVVLVKQ